MKFNLAFLTGLLAGASLLRPSGAVAANARSVGDIYALDGYAPEPAGDLAGGNGGVYAANDKLIFERSPSAAILDGREPAEVIAANDGNLEGFHLSQPLTEFATGAPDGDGLQELLNRIAPPVPTGMRFSYQIHTEAEERQAPGLSSIRRPIGGDFPIVRLTGTETQGRVFNIGLTTFVDDDQGGLDQAVRQRHVMNLLNRILRAQLVHAVDLIDSAASEVGSTNWGSSTSNPDGNTRADLRAAKLARGMKSSTVMYGDAAWLYRQDAYEQPARNNSGQKASYTPEQLAAYLRVRDVIVAEDTKRSSATALADIVGSATYNFMTDPTATTDDVSNVKQFVMGGLEVFIERLTKRTKITVSKYANTLLTSSVGIKKRTITYS